jgi:DNA-binding NtrC family response regulator
VTVDNSEFREKESPRLRVLVVDDEPLIRWAIAETLTQAGDVVVEAADGATALRVLSEPAAAFNVVLLDLRLPDSQDLTLLSSIRRTSPAAVVVVMTAFASDDVVSGVTRLGVRQIVGKPFDLRDLAGVVHRAGSSWMPDATGQGPPAGRLR